MKERLMNELMNELFDFISTTTTGGANNCLGYVQLLKKGEMYTT